MTQDYYIPQNLCLWKMYFLLDCDGKVEIAVPTENYQPYFRLRTKEKIGQNYISEYSHWKRLELYFAKSKGDLFHTMKKTFGPEPTNQKYSEPWSGVHFSVNK